MPKAVRFDQYGGIDVLHVADVDMPVPGAGEVVVAVRAAGTNPGEAAVRGGAMDAVFPARFPSGQGSDLAGVVDGVGPDVSSFGPGDEVLGWSEKRSSQAQYVVVPANQLIPKPADLGWEVAGALYVAGVTAYAAARAVGAGPGDTVLVSGAAGGVGSITVQLLQVRGVERVIGVASEPNHEWLTSIGVIPVAYGDGLIDAVRDLAPSGVDACIDTFGGGYVQMAVDLGVAPERIDTIIDFDGAKQLGAKAEGSSEATSTDVLAAMAELVASGRITVPIARTFPLDAVRDAYTELEQRHTRGKIVLIP